jgi:hypothetical protein
MRTFPKRPTLRCSARLVKNPPSSAWHFGQLDSSSSYIGGQLIQIVDALQATALMERFGKRAYRRCLVIHLDGLLLGD